MAIPEIARKLHQTQIDYSLRLLHSGVNNIAGGNFLTPTYKNSVYNAFEYFGNTYRSAFLKGKSPFVTAAEYTNRKHVYASFTLLKEPAEEVYHQAFDPLFQRLEQLPVIEQVKHFLDKDQFEMHHSLQVAKLYLQLAFSPAGFYQSPPTLEHTAIADTLFARAQTQYDRYLQLFEKVNPSELKPGEIKHFIIKCKQAIGGLNQYALSAWTTLAETPPDVESQLLAPKVMEDYRAIIEEKKQKKPPEFIDPDDPNYPRNVYVSFFGKS